MNIDLSKLHEDDLEFLTEWANNLGVSIEDLVIKILSAICDGDQFVAGRPE